jgi:2',3'-cyclic-nucleotide 2'-phosphodiesterase (5'-nucleotidase family)
MHFPFVSDNARDARKRIIDGRRMIEVDGVRIGIIGVVSREYATSEIFIEDPRQAVEDAATAMRKQVIR